MKRLLLAGVLALAASLTAAASRAWTRRVAEPKQLPGVLREALAVVRDERRQALIDIKVLPD